jgi:hypothetical protein
MEPRDSLPFSEMFTAGLYREPCESSPRLSIPQILYYLQSIRRCFEKYYSSTLFLAYSMRSTYREFVILYLLFQKYSLESNTFLLELKTFNISIRACQYNGSLYLQIQRYVFGKFSVQISARTPSILTEICCGPPHFLQANARRVP